MPQAANIVIADAQATPVNHTFVPLGPDANGVFWWEDQSAASAAGYWRISASLQRPRPVQAGESTEKRMYKATVVLSEPILEVVSNSTISGIAPAPIVSYIPKCKVEFLLPERSSLQARKDLRKMAALALADSQIVAMTETLMSIY